MDLLLRKLEHLHERLTLLSASGSDLTSINFARVLARLEELLQLVETARQEEDDAT